jgi:hypothetical protein
MVIVLPCIESSSFRTSWSLSLSESGKAGEADDSDLLPLGVGGLDQFYTELLGGIGAQHARDRGLCDPRLA